MPRPRDAAPALTSLWPDDRGGHLWAKDREAVLPDGTRIRYTVRGRPEAPWIVLAPGFLCPDNFWRDLGPELLADHRVVMFNHRGVGASSEATGTATPPAADAYTIPRLGDDVAAILDAEEIDEATLVGHSMGVQVAVEVALRLPDRVRALILVAGSHASPFDTMYGSSLGRYVFPAISMLGAATPREVSRRVLSAIELPPARRVGIALQAVADHTPWTGMTPYRAHLSRMDPRTVIWTARGMHGYDAGPQLPRIAVPTSVVVGTRDGWCPVTVGEHQAAAIPDARLTVMEGASHTLPLEHPDVILRQIAAAEARA